MKHLMKSLGSERLDCFATLAMTRFVLWFRLEGRPADAHDRASAARPYMKGAQIRW